MYKFYFIKTPRTLDWIEQLLYQIGYATNQFYLKVIRDSSNRETDRTLVYIDERVYHILAAQNRIDFKIEPFIVQRNMHPNLTYYTYNFCIPFPLLEDGSNQSTTQRDKQFLQHIETKLAPFVTHGILPHDSYQVNVPVVSRERNVTRGIAFISFHPSISKDTIATIRMILDQTKWNDGITPMRWFWARISNKVPKRSDEI